MNTQNVCSSKNYNLKLSHYANSIYQRWLLYPYESHYNLVFDYNLIGNLDIDNLNNAIKKYVSDNLLINSNVIVINETPFWQTCHYVDPILDYYEQVSENFLLNKVIEPFDLCKEKLYRFFLIKKSEKSYRFIIILHHILIDGNAMEYWVSDKISQYYNGSITKANDSILNQKMFLQKSENLQFKLFSKIKNEAFKFWQKVVLQAPPIQLDFIKKNNESESIAIADIKFNFNEMKISKILDSCSYFVYSLCIFAVTLYRFTGQNKFGIVCPFAITKHQAYLMGIQTNLIIIPFEFNDDITFMDLITTTKKFIKNIKTNNYHCYIIDGLFNLQESKSYFNVSFSQSNLRAKSLSFNKISCSANSNLHVDVNANMLLFEQQLIDNKLEFRFRYHKNDFNSKILVSIIDTYKYLFTNLLPNLMCQNLVPIANIALSEKKNVDCELIKKITSIHKIKSKYSNPIQIFNLVVKQYPDKLAILTDKSSLTYAELNKKTDIIAEYLSKNFTPFMGQGIAIYFEHNIDMLIAIIGIMKINSYYIPIKDIDNLNQIIEQSNVNLLLVDNNKLIKIKKKQNCNLVNINEILSNANYHTINLNYRVNNDNKINYILFTSGTTGTKKSVAIKHTDIIELFEQTNKYWQFKIGERWLLTHRYTFDASIWEIWGALLSGGTLVIPKLDCIYDMQYLYSYCISFKINILTLTATVLQQFSLVAIDKFRENPITSLSYLFFGGDVIRGKGLKQFFNLYFKQTKIIGMYGLTEATFLTSFYTLTDNISLDKNCLGKVLPDQIALVLDGSRNIVPNGCIGELYIAGNRLADGYLNNSKLTKKKFISLNFNNVNIKAFKTGDLVRFDECDYLWFLCRHSKEQKIGGNLIDLNLINQILMRHPLISDCFSIIVREDVDSSHLDYICVYYTAEKKLEMQLLVSYCFNNLPSAWQPQGYIYLNQLPLTANGKPDLSKFPSSFRNITNDNYAKPNTTSEKIMCNYFAEVLGIDRVGLYDDFFRLGGSSFKAMELIFKLKNFFDCTLNDIFYYRTPLAMLNYYETTKLDEDKKIIQEDNVKILNNNTPEVIKFRNARNILLTGATGFLGSHILRQLLLRGDSHIYLLLRGKNKQEALQKLNKNFNHYFGYQLHGDILIKITIILGDITLVDLGLSSVDYNLLTANIDNIIHSAAITKLYGESSDLQMVNVAGTQHIINLVKNSNNCVLHYISTLSVLFDQKNNSNCDENYIPDLNSKYDIPYCKTKLESEYLVLDAISANKIKAHIYRVGNLAYTNVAGKITTNISNNASNGFDLYIAGIYAVGSLPLCLAKVSISTADSVAEAITNLFDKNLTNSVFHIDSGHIYNLLNISGILKLQKTSEKTFLKNIDVISKFSKYHYLMKFLTNYLNNAQNFSDVNINKNITDELLLRVGFKYPRQSEENFYNYVSKVIVNIFGNDFITSQQVFDRLSDIAKALPVPFCWLDLNQYYLGTNDVILEAVQSASFEQFFNNKTPFNVHPYEFAKAIVNNHKSVIAKSEVLQTEENIKDFSSGKTRYINATIAPIYNSFGAIVGTYSISIDVTAHKEKEDEKLKNVALQTLSASIAHELRTPIAAMKFYNDGLNQYIMNLITSHDLAKKAGIKVPIIPAVQHKLMKKLLTRSNFEIEHMSNIINMMIVNISHSNIDNTNFTTCYINECIEALLDRYILPADKQDIVNWQTKKQDFAFHGSELYVVHVLFNLLKNSLYFIEKKGSGDIYIWTDKQDNYNQLHFKDTGYGISEKDIDYVFDKFYTKNSDHGSGIGLAFAKMVMQAHKGDIKCFSKENKYTEFILYFPTI